jgi:hypothetical protein
MRQMARGLSYAEAASESHRGVSTVRTLLQTAYRRLGVASIAQALALCSSAGWLDPVVEDGAAVHLADRRVTWAQRLYLEAFDQSLRAGTDAAELRRTQRLREAALTGMFKDARKQQPWRAATRDPIEAIADAMLRLGTGPEQAPTGDA